MTTTTSQRFTVGPTKGSRIGSWAIHDHERKTAADFGFYASRDYLKPKADRLERGLDAPSLYNWNASGYDASLAPKPVVPSFAEGDLVRATKGDETYTGIVGEVDEGYIGRLEDDIEELHEAGFTLTLIRKAPVTLPTEEGYYVRSSNTRATPGDAVYALVGGEWFSLGYSSGRKRLTEDAVRGILTHGKSLVRLAPKA